MKQKVEKHHLQIRRQQLHSIFQKQRAQLLCCMAKYPSGEQIKQQLFDSTELISQQIESLTSDLKIREYENMYPPLHEIEFILKGEKQYPVELRQEAIGLGLFGKVIDILAASFEDRTPLMLFQQLSIKCVSIVHLTIGSIPSQQLRESQNCKSLHRFLQTAMTEPMSNQRHMTKILDIMMELFIVNPAFLHELASTGDLSLNGPLFVLQQKQPKLQSTSTSSLDSFSVCLLSLLSIFFSQNQVAVTAKERPLSSCLNLDQKDLCFDFTHHCFLELSGSPSNTEGLFQALEVMRLMIQQGCIKLKRHHIDLKAMIGLMACSSSSCSRQAKREIMLIIDHIVFMEQRNYICYMVYDCKLMEVLSAQLQLERQIVFNVAANLAMEPELKRQMSGLLRLMLNDQQMELEVCRVLYNWLDTQQFSLLTQIDHDIVSWLRKRVEMLEMGGIDHQNQKEQAISLLWSKITEKGYQ